MIKNMNDIAPPKHMKNSCELSEGGRTRELTLSYDNFRVSNGIINPRDTMVKPDTQPCMNACTLLRASFSPPENYNYSMRHNLHLLSPFNSISRIS